MVEATQELYVKWGFCFRFFEALHPLEVLSSSRVINMEQLISINTYLNDAEQWAGCCMTYEFQAERVLPLQRLVLISLYGSIFPHKTKKTDQVWSVNNFAGVNSEPYRTSPKSKLEELKIRESQTRPMPPFTVRSRVRNAKNVDSYPQSASF